MADLDETYLGLRGQFLGLASEPGAAGLRGALMDLGMAGVCASVVCAADGSTSLYFSSGGGTIGAGAHEAVARANAAFRAAVEERLDLFQPADGAAPVLDRGTVQLVAVTAEGLRVLTVPEAEAQQESAPAYPLYMAGQGVITQIRLASG